MKRIVDSLPTFAIVAALLLVPAQAQAWMRPRHSDAEVVKDAELIAVAHVKPGSIVYVPHVVPEGHGASWENHAVLLITEVLKGHAASSEVPVIIHYGLSPVVGDRYERDLFAPGKAYPQGPIQIFDTGNSMMGLPSISGDIRQDQLWFLRVRMDGKDDEDENRDSTGSFGVWDPENVQRLELKPIYQALLSDHPENKLKACIVGTSPLAVRAKRDLAHLKMDQALQEPDLVKRAEWLLPYYLSNENLGFDSIHREASCDLRFHCGQAGAALLVPIFHDPRYQDLQSDILEVWSYTKYTESLPMVIDLLNTQNQFWTQQTRAQLALYGSTEGPTREQLESYDLSRTALGVLQSFADPQTRPVVQQTQELWRRLHVEMISDDLLKQSEVTLTAIDKSKASKQN